MNHGVGGVALSWISSYLTERRQCVRHAGRQSAYDVIMFGVPQGSVLGPLLFVLYTADLVPLIIDHGLRPHLYADDTQVYGWCQPRDVDSLQANMSRCVGSVRRWMRSNRLQLNTDKTEYIWCASCRRRHHIPSCDVQVGSDTVHPVQSARDLGVYIDGGMTMRTHISHVLSSCYSALRQIRSIKRSLPAHALRTLVTSLVHSRLDYCNVVFAGLPACDLQRLQSVLNTAVRLVADSSRRDHVTPLLREYHWLPIKQRVDYKLCTMVHRCLYGDAPSYLGDLIVPNAVANTRTGLRSALSNAVAVPRTHSSLGDRAFAAAGPRAWNKLPSRLRSIESPDCFKRQLKTFLFDAAFQ
jgi:Reverse transcriptase (RNA-dependent DNA polymerase)